MQEKVSVVVTCYNYGQYLGGAIDSVLNQTYKNIEIVLVNDGSTDNSEFIASKYFDESRFVYISQENSGQANAKNTGIKASTGVFIAFLDADDRWCPEKLEKQMACFKNAVVGVVYCRAKYLDEDDREINYEMTNLHLQPRRGKITDYLLVDNFIQFSSSVVRKECLDEFGLFDEALRMGIDWDLWLRISTAYSFDFVDERLFYYRMGHSGQMSKNIEVRQQCSDRIVARFLMDYPNAVRPEVLRKAAYQTFCNRGEHFRFVDKKKSYSFFFKAIQTAPLNTAAYKGIVKNFINYNSRDLNSF
jgi:glycosyltransferase involved in cell wall biosynthesis